jgi:hypothetical protein
MPIFLKPGNTWVQVVRCCNMYGVTVNQGVDINATETPAALTATARGPRIDQTLLPTQQIEFAITQQVSAATAQLTTTPNALPGLNGGTAAPPQSILPVSPTATFSGTTVGMAPGQ